MEVLVARQSYCTGCSGEPCYWCSHVFVIRIQQLSLRSCYVNDMGAKFIGAALTTNKTLVTLNLCYNKITCEGAGFLAKVSYCSRHVKLKLSNFNSFSMCL